MRMGFAPLLPPSPPPPPSCYIVTIAAKIGKEQVNFTEKIKRVWVWGQFSTLLKQSIAVLKKKEKKRKNTVIDCQ